MRLADDGCPHAEPPVRLLTPTERAAVLEQWAPLVWSLARKWGAPYGLTPDQTDDLAGAIRLGFVDAANRFEPDRGYVFSTYANWWARNYAGKWLQVEAAGGLHVPHYHGRVGIVVGSIETVAGGGKFGDPAAPGEWIADHRGPPEGESPFGPGWWADAVRGLPDRERAFLLATYRDGRTLQSIAEEHGLSRERVRQIMLRGLEWLRANRPGLADDLPA